MAHTSAFHGKTIAVFCGSASGKDHDYEDSAFAVGQALARAGHKIIFGGGHVGLMGAMADGCLDAGGHIVGIIPSALVEHEIAHQGLAELVVVNNMHERKAEMADRSDAFMVLPGGSGTLEEVFEQGTWAHIGYHEKPIGLLNIKGYFDPLLMMFDKMVDFGFLSDTHRKMLFDDTDANEMLSRFANYVHPPVKGYRPSG
jgi:uncharacterized protein (TIGR00730 family)